MSGALPTIRDRGNLERTRLSWHSIAEHVLAAARYQAEQRIGLVATSGGFGTPAYGAGRSARVRGHDLVVADPAGEQVVRLTTVGDAARALGIEPGAPPVYAATTPLSPDAPLQIDADAARVLADWFDLTSSVLSELGGAVTLWPEHFDVATEIGDEARGERGTFGASPGDGEHPEPYLYVTHWSDVPDDAYWNDDAFGGASLDYRTVAQADDAAAAVRAFYARGRAILLRRA